MNACQYYCVLFILHLGVHKCMIYCACVYVCVIACKWKFSGKTITYTFTTKAGREASFRKTSEFSEIPTEQ